MLIEKIQIMKIMKVAKILTRKSQLTFPVYTFPPCILGFKTDSVSSVCSRTQLTKWLTSDICILKTAYGFSVF